MMILSIKSIYQKFFAIIILGYCLGFYPFQLEAQDNNIITRHGSIITIAGVKLTYAEIPVYNVAPQPQTAFLAMAYAQHQILTPYNWSPKERKGKIPVAIDLIYTKFPFDTAAWITKYDRLMPNRIKSLFRFDPQLAKLPITWRLVAQTACVTEPLAESFFHGFAIRYRFATAQDSLQQSKQPDKILTDQTDVKPSGNPVNKTEKEPNADDNKPPQISAAGDDKADNKTNNKISDTDVNTPKNSDNPVITNQPDKTNTQNPITQHSDIQHNTVSKTDTTPEIRTLVQLLTAKPKKTTADTAQIAINTEKKQTEVAPEKKLQLDIEAEINADLERQISGREPRADSISAKKKTKKPKIKEIYMGEEPKQEIPKYQRPAYLDNQDSHAFIDSQHIQMRNVYAKMVEQEMKVVEDIIYQRQDLHDSVVYKALSRHPEWSDMTVVMDWTGSMYPFGAQLVGWHRLNIAKGLVKHLAIFNDGDDNTRDPFFKFNKPLGKAGGIYFCNPKNIEDVITTMKKTMLGGDGGPDIDENNIEACLRTLAEYPQSDKILMIADKDAFVRDISLLSRIKVPVHIIVCGKRHYIEPDYLTIAYHTGGGIYDIKEDIDFKDPKKVMRKSVIKINKIKYILNPETQRFELLPRKRFFPF